MRVRRDINECSLSTDQQQPVMRRENSAEIDWINLTIRTSNGVHLDKRPIYGLTYEFVTSVTLSVKYNFRGG